MGNERRAEKRRYMKQRKRSIPKEVQVVTDLEVLATEVMELAMVRNRRDIVNAAKALLTRLSCERMDKNTAIKKKQWMENFMKQLQR